MKKLILVFGIIIMATSFIGCNFQGSLSKMHINKAKLTEKEENLISLLIPNLNNSIFDFKVDHKVKSVEFNMYKLKEKKWEKINNSGVLDFKDESGRIAIDFENLQREIRIAIQSGNNSTAIRHEGIETISGDNIAVATSYLSNNSKIEYEKEIPLAVQIITSKNEFSSYTVEHFYEPEEYGKSGAEEVYAMTVKFSENKISN